MTHRRVSKRDHPRHKRAPFNSARAAIGYARSQGWPVTEHISTQRGDRIQVITRGGPRTFRVKEARVGPPRGEPTSHPTGLR